MLRRLGLMLLFVLDVKKCFTIGSQKVLAFLWLISFRYGFFCFLALSTITNIYSMSHVTSHVRSHETILTVGHGKLLARKQGKLYS